jgi:hypothetical protein
MKSEYEVKLGDGGFRIERKTPTPDEEHSFRYEEFFFTTWSDACAWLTRELVVPK